MMDGEELMVRMGVVGWGEGWVEENRV